MCKIALCDWNQSELSAYVETALQEGLAIAGSDFPRFRQHLNECEDCRDDVLKLLPLFWLLRTGLAAEPPREGKFDFWFLATKSPR